VFQAIPFLTCFQGHSYTSTMKGFASFLCKLVRLLALSWAKVSTLQQVSHSGGGRNPGVVIINVSKIEERALHLLLIKNFLGNSMFLFRPSASYFSLLAQRISNQKKCTLASAFILRCSLSWASSETRPSGLHTAQATAELKQPLAECSHADCATRRVR